MSHRVVIIDSIKPALQNEEVREHFTSEQCTKIDQILAKPEPTDDEFRKLTRRLCEAYCSED